MVVSKLPRLEKGQVSDQWSLSSLGILWKCEGQFLVKFLELDYRAHNAWGPTWISAPWRDHVCPCYSSWSNINPGSHECILCDQNHRTIELLGFEREAINFCRPMAVWCGGMLLSGPLVLQSACGWHATWPAGMQGEITASWQMSIGMQKVSFKLCKAARQFCLWR